MEESLDAFRPTESPAETVPSSEPETIATATTESAAEEAVPAPEEVTRVPNQKRHTSELQSRSDLVCRLLLEKKKKKQ